MHARLLISSLILYFASSAANACAIVEGMAFADHLKEQQTIAIIRVEALRLDRGEHYESMLGRLRVVETLKGKPAKFTSIEVDGLCNDIRLNVGGYYLIATSQRKSKLMVGFGHSWVIDISPEYTEGKSRELYDPPVLEAVERYLSGGSLPSDFPGAEVRARTHK